MENPNILLAISVIAMMMDKKSIKIMSTVLLEVRSMMTMLVMNIIIPMMKDSYATIRIRYESADKEYNVGDDSGHRIGVDIVVVFVVER